MSEQENQDQTAAERRDAERRRNAELDFGAVERRKGDRRSRAAAQK
ncbi:MAG: hypothetical protein ACXWUP_07630 [Allosphingosinicella sp.]